MLFTQMVLVIKRKTDQNTPTDVNSR